jgi:hypothetical protein
LRASFRNDDGEGDLADALKGWSSTAAIANEEKVRASDRTSPLQQKGHHADRYWWAKTKRSVTICGSRGYRQRSDRHGNHSGATAKVGENTAAIQETAGLLR